MEGLPRHKRSCFKRSAMSFRIQLPTSNSSSSDSRNVVVPKTHSQDKPPKSKGFLSFLFGKKNPKVKRPNLKEGYHTTLEERDVRKLIRLYCKHDNLYNPRSSYYGNKEIEEDCYNDMARSIPGKSSSELRSCIEELRHLFEREYRIIESARRSSGEVLTPSIHYYNEFLFLVPHLCIDLDKSHGGSGTSLLNPKSVINPPSANLKTQLATKDLLCNRLTQFTGFPLAAFPGNISCCTKILSRRALKKSKEQQKCDRGQEPPKVTFSRSAEQGPVDGPCIRNSKVSIASSYYSDEQDIKTTDLTCPWQSDNSYCEYGCQDTALESPESLGPMESMKSGSKATSESSEKGHSCPFRQDNQHCVSKCRESMKSGSKAASESSEKGHSCPHRQDNQPCVSKCREDRKEAAPEPKKDDPSVAKYRNDQQVQMLCDMIRTELTAAPDFIYFDAKWRIIEILREVHKRQLVHMKATPQQNGRRQQLNQLMMQHHPYKPNRHSSAPTPMKAGFTRICNHIKGANCPYCCCSNNC